MRKCGNNGCDKFCYTYKCGDTLWMSTLKSVANTLWMSTLKSVAKLQKDAYTQKCGNIVKYSHLKVWTYFLKEEKNKKKLHTNMYIRKPDAK